MCDVVAERLFFWTALLVEASLKGREEECGTSHPSAESLFRTSMLVSHHA